MANADFGTGKSLVVLAIVIGCFAILWPKIFYPMMQTAFAMTSPNMDGDSPFRETDRPPHLHPGSINPRLRNSMPSDVEDKFHMREGRPFPHPQARQPVKSQPKSGGAMSIIMPIYTVGIIVFFLYTVLKLVFKKNPQEADKKPLIKDFHMDPQYRKFMCDQSSDKNIQDDPKPTKTCKPAESTIPEKESQDLDPKDYEIFKLKKKLEETEEAMNRIMEHMGAMSACLSGMDNNTAPTQNSEVRQRHKGHTKHSEKEKCRQTIESSDCHRPVNRPDESEFMSDAKRLKLQEDLAKAMLSAAQVSTKSSMEKLLQNSADHDGESNSDHTDSEGIGDNSAESNGNESSKEIVFTHKGDKKEQNDDYYSEQCCKISQSEKAL